MLDLNNIYLMDCLEGLSKLDDNSIDLVVTSPPYYNAREYAQWETYNSYLNFISDVVSECARVLKTGGFICWNVSPRIVVDGKKYSIGYDSQSILENCLGSREIENDYAVPQLTYYDNLIWLKPKGGYRLSFAETKWQHMSKKGDRPVRLMPRYENIFVYSKGDPFTNRIEVPPQLDKDFWHWGNVCDLPVDHLPGHHGVFPIELPKLMIDWFCTGDVVLDPFMGRGTTAAAAIASGKQFIGFEIHEEFVEFSKEYLK